MNAAMVAVADGPAALAAKLGKGGKDAAVKGEADQAERFSVGIEPASARGHKSRSDDVPVAAADHEDAASPDGAEDDAVPVKSYPGKTAERMNAYFAEARLSRSENAIQNDAPSSQAGNQESVASTADDAESVSADDDAPGEVATTRAAPIVVPAAHPHAAKTAPAPDTESVVTSAKGEAAANAARAPTQANATQSVPAQPNAVQSAPAANPAQAAATAPSQNAAQAKTTAAADPTASGPATRNETSNAVDAPRRPQAEAVPQAKAPVVASATAPAETAQQTAMASASARTVQRDTDGSQRQADSARPREGQAVAQPADKVRSEIAPKAAPAQAETPNKEPVVDRAGILAERDTRHAPKTGDSEQVSSADVRVVADKADGAMNQPPISTTSRLLTASIAASPQWAEALRHAASVSATSTVTQAAPTVVNSLKIQLHPVELGQVTAVMRIQGGELTVEIQVESAEAYKQLSSDQDSLVQRLRGHGYGIEQITIQHVAGDRGNLQQNGQAFQQPGDGQLAGDRGRTAEGGNGQTQSGGRGNSEAGSQQRPAAADLADRGPADGRVAGSVYL